MTTRIAVATIAPAPEVIPDPLIGAGGFDFISDLGATIPMRTIGYLSGIPEADQADIRDRGGAFIEMSEGHEPGEVNPNLFADSIAMSAEYIERRADHPSDANAERAHTASVRGWARPPVITAENRFGR